MCFQMTFQKGYHPRGGRSIAYLLKKVLSLSISICTGLPQLKRKMEIESQVKYLLAHGFIRPSQSPWGSPILFVPTPNGKLRMCVDYRAVNALTVKNRYPLPRIDDLLDHLQGAKVFSTIDLQSGYMLQVRIHEADIPKTAFITHQGLYEYTVLPFGLTNAPATFQTLMNRMFAKHLNKSVLVYMDDVMIFSKVLKNMRKLCGKF